jgi:hypothetical protein
VKQGVLVLGRASSSDLRLQHPSISRRHAQLTRRGERLFLKDLGSQNGTFVNRARLTTEVELHAGDMLALGNALLRVRFPGASQDDARDLTRSSASPIRGAMSSRRLVLLGAAMGSLVAVLLTLAVVKLLRSKSEPAAQRTHASTQGTVQASVAVAPPTLNRQAETQALAHYEAGRAEAALAVARQARLESLAARLARFQDAWRAGHAALTARNPTAALQHFSSALELDQELSQGRSAYAPQLREALLQAHQQTDSGPAGARNVLPLQGREKRD